MEELQVLAAERSAGGVRLTDFLRVGRVVSVGHSAELKHPFED